MKIFDTQFIPGGSLDNIAQNQAAADQFTKYLEGLASNGWTVEQVHQVSGGLLVVMSH